VEEDKTNIWMWVGIAIAIVVVIIGIVIALSSGEDQITQLLKLKATKAI
jgi:hypothetical protein